MSVNRHFQAKCAKYSNFCIINTTNQILHSDKDHQILVVGRPKICPKNPKWRTPAILKQVYLLTLMDRATLLHVTSSSAVAEGPRDALIIEILQLQNILFEN